MRALASVAGECGLPLERVREVSPISLQIESGPDFRETNWTLRLSGHVNCAKFAMAFPRPSGIFHYRSC